MLSRASHARTGSLRSWRQRRQTAAGVEHTVEIWPGHHGFAVPDQPVYDEALSERHWAALQTLYAAQLA